MHISGYFFLILFSQVHRIKGLIVRTKNGRLRGSIQENIDGGRFHAFKGIPYAKPPVGILRFQDPKPAESWDGIRNATKFGPMCSQLNSSKIESSEDCLYLNVYSKSLDRNARLPVLFWIHGDGFIAGQGDDSAYGPDYFLLKDVVLVTINFRLGVFGFLSLEDELMPGNQGLKDQVMALQWVRDNIVNFGGDPAQVTIFGESSGAWCVHYLSLSPLATGLFNNIISQSGTILTAGNYASQTPREFAFQLSALLGNDTKDTETVIDFLMKADRTRLLEAQAKMVEESMERFMIPFKPTVDNKSRNPFMPVDFEVAASRGIQVPLLIGYTSREAMGYLPIIKDNIEEFNDNMEQFLPPWTLKTLESYNLTVSHLKKLYLGEEKITKKNLDKMIDLVSDIQVVESIHRAVRIQVEKSSSPTYLYRFDYGKDPSPVKKILNTRISGAAHTDDLLYLFRLNAYEKIDLSEPLKKGSTGYWVMEQMIEMWVNFAATGNPSTSHNNSRKFEPVSNAIHFDYLNIDENMNMEATMSLEQFYASRGMS